MQTFVSAHPEALAALAIFGNPSNYPAFHILNNNVFDFSVLSCKLKAKPTINWAKRTKGRSDAKHLTAQHRSYNCRFHYNYTKVRITHQPNPNHQPGVATKNKVHSATLNQCPAAKPALINQSTPLMYVLRRQEISRKWEQALSLILVRSMQPGALCSTNATKTPDLKKRRADDAGEPMDTRSVTRRCFASWIPPRLACFTCFRLHIVDDDPIATPTTRSQPPPNLQTLKTQNSHHWSFGNPSPRLPSPATPRNFSSSSLHQKSTPRFLTKIVSKTT